MEDLIRLWPDTAASDIAALIGRTETSVRVKASRLGLTMRDLRQVVTERRCLMCLEMFRSESAARRICPRCRTSEEWRTTEAGTYPVVLRIAGDEEGD